jgi:hypothetical protein
MHKTLAALCSKLDETAARLRSLPKPDVSINRHGWNHPAVTLGELALFPETLAAKLREVAPSELPENLERTLAAYVERLESLQGRETFANLTNGNGSQAVPALLSTLGTLERICAPIVEWKTPDPKVAPPALLKRLSALRAAINSVEAEAADLSTKVALINSAHETAEALPAVLTQLKEARSEVEATATAIAKLQATAERDAKELKRAIFETEELKKRAAEVMAECEDTYRSVTAKGLAAAFHQRKEKLERSSWFWIVGLILALVIGALLGSYRLDDLSALLNSSEPKWGAIWMNVLLSVVGLGAPIWFAWMATKQVGQRFRLAEDYAYKAAVAQAYEGFRREADRHGGDFEQRLLSSALTRLDEAPLRWVEMETHGSPWHELVESPAFQQALQKFPDLRGAFAKAKKKRGETKRVSAEAEGVESAG